MSASGRILYQFPISHFSEKSRWNLDAKGISYRVHNLIPGLHLLVTKRLTKGVSGTVPILVDEEQVIHDSTDIALYLERAYPATPALIPSTAAERERVLELEDYFDTIVGKNVRRWVYAQLFDGNVDVRPLMFGALSPPVRLLGHAMYPLIRRTIRRQYIQTPAKVEASRVKLMEGIERLEGEIQGDPSRYLVGSSLSIADITAAALYAPMMMPEASPYALQPGQAVPPALAEMRARLLARPAGQWFLRRYQEDRRRLAHGFTTGTETESG
ncbi:glutathione S-transferase family protein [Melittangium boletus]|uniref:Putative glutathione S-transferase n=1 Tax=Melittangium boletus DSM 14713 TaxID=1294270 RepID=A0A250IIT7_9BACT|nr:glutathione S-transferase family protein [Melittangium boletus]ATB31665.1 putative glutathione S-transferase [Melittangium boletus DSM 14713]